MDFLDCYSDENLKFILSILYNSRELYKNNLETIEDFIGTIEAHIRARQV